jgi:hypothetical protein
MFALSDTTSGFLGGLLSILFLVSLRRYRRPHGQPRDLSPTHQRVLLIIVMLIGVGLIVWAATGGSSTFALILSLIVLLPLYVWAGWKVWSRKS